MGKLMNITNFLKTLPAEYDTWNRTYRGEYFSNNLVGFDRLQRDSQLAITAYFTRGQLTGFIDYASSFVSDPGSMVNATVHFFAAILSDTTEAESTSENYEATTQQADSICLNLFELEKSFVFIYLYPLIAVVVLMSLFKRRKRLWPKFIFGRPGVLYPINFVDEYARRWMYTSVFILLTYRIMYLFAGTFYFAPTLSKNLGFMKVFVVMLNVIILCTEFYPLLACIVMRKNVIANILGLLLLGPWIFALIVKYIECPPTSMDTTEGYVAIVETVYEVPLFISLLVLVIGYVYDLSLNIRKFYKNKVSDGEKLLDTQEELCMVYISTLMNKSQNDKPLTFKEKIKQKIRYTRIEGFKYPPRVVCTVMVGLYALFKTASELCGVSLLLFEFLTSFFQSFEIGFAASNSTQTYHLVIIYLKTANISALVSLIVSFFIQVLLMINFMTQYRKHIRKFFGGKHSWHYKYQASPANIVVSGMRYSGYQVAFLLYGYFIMSLVLFIVVMLVAGFIVIPLVTKTENFISRFFVNQLIALWPGIVVGLAIHYVQILMAKFVFLQDRGAHVALNNRRLYHVISYFLFFFNVVLGLFSCLKRILFSVVFGAIFISRLDRCLLMRGFEKFDSGFGSYLGMLTVDVYHNHPIVKGFVHILKEEVKKSKDIELKYVQHGESTTDSDEERCSKITKKNVRNKFWKMLTLVNNPSLVLERMRHDINEVKKGHASGILTNVVENIGGVGAVFLGGGVVSDLFTSK